MVKNDSPNDQSLLVEYQAAQNSAQHHDSIVWTSTGIIWSAELILIGFVIQNLINPSLKIIILLACFLAILLLIFLWTTAAQLWSVKIQKYKRCQEIESILHLKQHSNLQYKKQIGRMFYSILMTFFILIWIVIIISTIVAK